MKKSLNGFMLLTITSFTLFSCNQSKTEASAEKKSEQKRIEVNSTISGPIADYFTVNRAVIKVDTLDQSIVLVEIERTDKQLPFDPNDVDICDYDSVKTWRYCLSPDVLDENNLPLALDLSIFDREPLVHALNLNPGESKWLKFSCTEITIDNLDQAERLIVSSSFQPNKPLNNNDVFDFDTMENIDELIDIYKKTTDLYLESNGDIDIEEALDLYDDVLDLYEDAGGEDTETLRDAIDVLDNVNDLLKDW